jgi:hypothetical protein
LTEQIGQLLKLRFEPRRGERQGCDDGNTAQSLCSQVSRRSWKREPNEQSALAVVVAVMPSMAQIVVALVGEMPLAAFCRSFGGFCCALAEIKQHNNTSQAMSANETTEMMN